MTKNKEIWKDIPNYIGLYQASNIGNIKRMIDRYGNKNEHILAPSSCGRYLHVVLCKNNIRKTHRIHKLVLETFVGPCPKGMECRHLNGIKTDNRLCNLQYGTKKENQGDRILHKTDNKGSKHGMSKIIESQFIEIKKLLEEEILTQKEIGDIFNLSQSAISLINSGKRRNT